MGNQAIQDMVKVYQVSKYLKKGSGFPAKYAQLPAIVNGYSTFEYSCNFAILFCIFQCLLGPLGGAT